MINLKEIIAEQALKDEENLEVAFETYHSIGIVQKMAREKFVSSLFQKLKIELPNTFKEMDTDWSLSDTSEAFYININIQNPAWDGKFNIGVFDHDNDRLYFSVSRVNPDTNICQKVHTFFKAELKEGNDWANHWWAKVKDPYNRWESNLEGLKQFAFSNSTALNYFCGRIIEFVNLVEKIRKNPDFEQFVK